MENGYLALGINKKKLKKKHFVLMDLNCTLTKERETKKAYVCTILTFDLKGFWVSKRQKYSHLVL